MESLGRFLKRSSQTKNEQRFEKVAIGKDYLGTASEEWFDARTTPFRSEENLDKKPAWKLTSAEHREKESSGGPPPSTQLGEPSSTNSSAPQRTSNSIGKQRQSVQKPPGESVDEMVSTLMKFYRLGEEIVPLLVTLTKMGEEWSRTSAPSTSESGPHPPPKPVSEQGKEVKSTTPAASAEPERDTKATPKPVSEQGEEEKSTVPVTAADTDGDSKPTLEATNVAGDESQCKTPATMDTDEESAPTPSTSLSNGSNGHDSQPPRKLKPEDPGFSSLKEICSTQGLLRRPTDIGEHDVCDGINDEPTLQRFFDARKHDVSAARNQFQEAWDARKANNICAFYEKIGVPEFQETRNLYPAWSGRRDKAGQPICLFDVARLDSKTMAAYKKTSTDMKPLKTELNIPDKVSVEVLRASTIYEHLTRFIMPLCTSVPGRPNQDRAITKMIVLVDMSGIGLMQIWSLRGYIQDLGKLFATNYPEILSRVLIMNAPSYYPTIWGWIRKWVDPGTMEKLFILTPEEVMPTLQQYVDMANIPRKYGGEFDSFAGMEPALDPLISETLEWQASHASLPQGPMKWVDEGWGRRAAVAIGSSDGEDRNEKIAVLGARKRSQ